MAYLYFSTASSFIFINLKSESIFFEDWVFEYLALISYIFETKFNLSLNELSQYKSVNQKKLYSKEILKISEEEQKKHKEFSKTELRKNFY